MVGSFIYVDTHFASYDKFKKVTGAVDFPNELPKDAEKIKYYAYRVLGKESYAVAFSVGEDTFKSLKQDVEFEYKGYIDKNMGSEKNIKSNFKIVSENYIEGYSGYIVYYDKPMDDTIINNKHYSFLKSLIKDDLNNYRVVGYYNGGLDKHIISSGVLANEETRELVYFYSVDPYYYFR